jgi:hypothetical protein
MEEKIAAELRFSIIPEWVLYTAISDRAVRLYGVLARYADNQTHQAFPSRETLAKKMHCCTKSVDRATEELIEVGAVTKKQRHNSSLVYTLMTSQGVDSSVEGVVTPVSRGVDSTVDLTITTELEPLNDINHHFNSFWDIYPRKLGKGEARQAFFKAVTKHGHEVIMDGVRRLAEDPNLPAPQYVPRAATWLNQERWEDAPYEPVDVSKIPGVQVGVSRSPYVGGPREWVQDLHDMGEHFECKPGEFGCK